MKITCEYCGDENAVITFQEPTEKVWLCRSCYERQFREREPDYGAPTQHEITERMNEWRKLK